MSQAIAYRENSPLRLGVRFVGIFLGMVVASYFLGCTGEQPVGPSQAVTVGEAASQPGNPFLGSSRILALPGQYGRVHSTTGLVAVAEGGTLKVGVTINNGPGNFPTQIQVNLMFPAGAVSEDVYVTLKINEFDLSTGVDLEFGPHGMVFEKPALLNINTLNFHVGNVGGGPAHLSCRIDDSGPRFYCVDDGQTQEYESLNMNDWNGKITLTNAKIPHFSRYAFVRWAR